MIWARRFWLRLQTLFRRNRSTQRLNAEIQFHLDQQVAENLAAGMSREEAHYSARRVFGNPAFLKEETRDTWGWLWLEQFAQDVRYAARMLRKSRLHRRCRPYSRSRHWRQHRDIQRARSRSIAPPPLSRCRPLGVFRDADPIVRLTPVLVHLFLLATRCQHTIRVCRLPEAWSERV